MSAKRHFDIRGRLKAYEVLKREQITCLPVNPEGLITRHGYKLLTYDNYTVMTGIPIDDIIYEYGDDGFTVSGEDGFVICYNQYKGSGRVRWTLMHEFCHIELGHVGEHLSIIKRSNKNKDAFDQAADAMTARILCPSAVLLLCHVTGAAEISKLCGISMEAATYRWNHLQAIIPNKRFLTIPEEREITAQFLPWICQYLCDK